MEDMREDLNDISLSDDDLDELVEDNDLSGEDMSVDETEDASENKKEKSKNSGKKKKFPIIAVVGLLVVIVGVAVLGLVLGKRKNSNRQNEVIVNELPDNDEEETQRPIGGQSSEEILARVRGDNQDIMVDVDLINESDEVQEEIETDENGETIEATNRNTRLEEVELDTESKYEVIVEKPTVNYKDIEYSQDIEATYTITKFKEKNKEIFYAEQGEEKFKVDRVDVIAEGSISGLTGTWELTLPYSIEWKLGDMITITYKMGEIDSSSRAIIDLKVKDYNKITNEVILGTNNGKQPLKKAVIPNS